MKKLSIVLAILTLAALFVVPANAIETSSTDVLIGTPELDGIVDEIYYQSASYTATTADKVYTSGADYADCPEFEATTYILYDEDYIYLAVEVTDATPNSVAKDKILAASNHYVWQNDVCEFWIFQNGNMGQFNYDAGNSAVGMGGAASFVSLDLCEGAATKTDDGYIVEVKFPNETKTGDKVQLMTQINNGLNADMSKLVCIGGQKGAVIDFTLIDEPVFIEEEVEEAPATEAATTTEKATSTVDPITALVALAIAGAGVVVCKKRK